MRRGFLKIQNGCLPDLFSRGFSLFATVYWQTSTQTPQTASGCFGMMMRKPKHVVAKLQRREAHHVVATKLRK
jgi:hypothetical protein